MKRSYLLCVAMLGAVGACDGSNGEVSVGEGRDPRFIDGGADAGLDAAAEFDAAMDPDLPFVVPDGATMDAAALGYDGAVLPDGAWVLEDGAILLADGAVLDREAILAMLADPDMSNCEISNADVWQAGVQLANEGGYDLVPGGLGFGLAYHAITGGDCAQAINVARPPSTGDIPIPHSLLDECNIVRDLGLLAVDDRWLLSWVDNASGMADLYTMELDQGMQPAGPRQQITDSVGVFEFRPTLALVNERPLLVWISRDTTTDEHWITARFLDGDQAEFAVLERGTAQKPQALAVSNIGLNVGAIAWVGSIDNPGVWLQPLGDDARPAGERFKLTDEVASSSSVSLGWRMDGGGIAYSVVIDGHPQVRFWRLDRNAKPTADERTVLGAPNFAQDASIYALGGGYALTYRALPRSGQSGVEIRLLFLTREGTTMRDSVGRLVTFPIAEATVGNSRTDVVVSIEGQIMVAWLDADPSSSGNLLKVVRRRLDCR